MVTPKTIKTKFILSSKDGHFFSLVPLQKAWEHFGKWKVQQFVVCNFLSYPLVTLNRKRGKRKEKKREEAVASGNTPRSRAVLK
jgi:hypothetical protein